MDLKFRYLIADEVECRVAQATEKGVSLLLYKDARCDMNILDETVGAMNWQRHHSRENANCIVSIFCPEMDMWVEKEDTGTESNTEAEKGLASDSFKRACFNWGIGRELYTAPFIWIPADKCTIFKGQNGKPKCNDHFEVADMTVENGRIKSLLITLKGQAVFVYGSTAKTKITCENCGNPLTETKDKQGKAISAIELQKMSRARFSGRTYCAVCQRKIFDELTNKTKGE